MPLCQSHIGIATYDAASHDTQLMFSIISLEVNKHSSASIYPKYAWLYLYQYLRIQLLCCGIMEPKIGYGNVKCFDYMNPCY
jgi:hypothetical protein